MAADHLANHYGPASVSITSREFNGSDKRELFFYGLEKTVRLLLAAGKKVVIMNDTPELPFFPRDAIRLPVNALGGMSLPRSSVMARQAELRTGIENLRRKHPEVTVYDPLDVVCDASSCPIVMGDTLLYKDSHHLSTRGSKIVAAHLLAAIGIENDH